jgi:Flp pilus assembly pilin Flp
LTDPQNKERVMKSMLKRFVSDERGLEMVEYGVLVALIVVALVLVVPLLIDAISSKFSEATSAVAGSGN